MATLPAGSRDRATLAQSPVTPILAEITEDGGARTDGDFSAVAMALIDSTLIGDEGSLRVLQDWLRDERARCAGDQLDGQANMLQGRLLGLLDANHWAIERALPLTDIGRLERGSHSHEFLRKLVTAPGLTNSDLAKQLEVDDSEISRVGKKLREDGLVIRRQFGRTKRWELTPKGRRTLELLDGVGAVLKPSEDKGEQPGEARAVGGAIVTLINEGRVKLDRLREEVAEVADVGREVADQTLQQLAKNDFLTVRARKIITLNERRATAIGVRVTSAEVVGVLTGPVGNELTKILRRPLPSTDVATVVRSIADLVDEILMQNDLSAEAVVGLGVELAGHVDGRTGSVVFSPDLKDSDKYWRDVPLRELLEDATGLQTVVENDTNALALHEQLFGLGRDVSDFAAVFIGQEGVGCGLVIGGTLAHGSAGIAGEFGHLIVDQDGDKCRCGKRGCLETVVSVAGIRESLAKAAGDEFEDPLLIVGQEAYKKEVSETFTHAGDTLGFGLASILNLINPARVIIFGPPLLTEEKDPSARVFMKAVRESAQKYSFSFAGQHYDLRFERFDDTSGPKGAASAVISRLVGRRTRLMAATRRSGPGRLLPELGSPELAQRVMTGILASAIRPAQFNLGLTSRRSRGG